MPHPWPLFDLRIHTPRLELRVPTDGDVLALLDVARGGIHDPNWMPFDAPWTDATGTEFDQGFLKFFWRSRATWTPEAWQLPFAVFSGGRPVGVQELRATDFAGRQTVATGSWLGLAEQRMGVGTEMRAAVLSLAFECLGATMALSAAAERNVASRRVSEKLGYRPNGSGIIAPRGLPVRQLHYMLLREDFPATAWPARFQGLEGCRPMFSLDEGT